MRISKILAVGACAALLVSSAFAEGVFVGGEVGFFGDKGKYRTNAFETGKDPELGYVSKTKAIYNLGLKIGYIITDNHRVYGAYGYGSPHKFTDEDGVTLKMPTHKFLFGYDFTPQIREAWRGVLGFYTGYTFGKLKAGGKDFSTSANHGGFAYGAKIGLLYEINENNEIEFGTRVEQLRFKEKNHYVGKDMTVGVKPTHTNFGLYMGYAYKF